MTSSPSHKELWMSFYRSQSRKREMATKDGILFVSSHSCDLICIDVFLQFVCNSAQEDCRKPPGRNQHTESTKRNEEEQDSARSSEQEEMKGTIKLVKAVLLARSSRDDC